MTDESFVNFIEKRIFKRVDSTLRVLLSCGGKKMKAESANISCGGIYLNLKKEKQIRLSDPLEIIIHLPHCKNPVVMPVDLIRQDEVHGGLALKFQGLYNDKVLEIEKFIKSKLH